MTIVETLDINGAEAWLYRPTGAQARLPAFAIGAEATGVNMFIHDVARNLAALGFVAVIPDYYRGAGPIDPEDYTDVDEIMRHVNTLDFVRAAHDLMDTVQLLVHHPAVDPARVGVWGYCTGATLAWLTACLRPDVSLAVLFYPSQPVFEKLSLTRPVHPMDLVWNLACPVYFVYGALDLVMPPELLSQLRERLQHWGIDHVIRLFEGCGHSFGAPVPGQNLQAYGQAWAEAVSYAAQRLGLDER